MIRNRAAQSPARNCRALSSIRGGQPRFVREENWALPTSGRNGLHRCLLRSITGVCVCPLLDVRRLWGGQNALIPLLVSHPRPYAALVMTTRHAPAGPGNSTNALQNSTSAYGCARCTPPFEGLSWLRVVAAKMKTCGRLPQGDQRDPLKTAAAFILANEQPDEAGAYRNRPVGRRGGLLITAVVSSPPCRVAAAHRGHQPLSDAMLDGARCRPGQNASSAFRPRLTRSLSRLSHTAARTSAP